MKKIIFFSLIIAFLGIGLIAPKAEAALCKVGDKAEVLWGGKWWPAKVIAVNDKGNLCKIHYIGYGSKWDEWVGKSRIRIGPTAPPPGKEGPYYVGQPIKVLWGGKWWNAEILRKKGPKYYIKYDGYSSKWNEWVTVSRMKPR